MNLLLLILIFPAIVFAGNINISFSNHDGQSSYVVDSANTQNLKSELLFPFNFNSIDLEYGHTFQYFIIGLNSSFLLTSQETTGEDYDWQNKNLTVYSKSNNKVNKYYDFGITLSKVLSDNVILFSKFNYRILNIKWMNTYQEDYVQNRDDLILGNTLQFKQKFYQYNFGIDYKYNIFKKISLELAPSLIYAQIKTKDIHELRDFYTIQNIKSFGYAINFNLNYSVTIKSNLVISFNYTDVKNKNVNMNYYNNLNENYLSYPSSYNYKDRIISVHYNYIF